MGDNLSIYEQLCFCTARIETEDSIGKSFSGTGFFPGSSGSPVLICNVGGYTDKKGNLNWGASRVYLLGILYAGPQMRAVGDIQVVTVPDSQQKAVSVSQIPNNLGFIIKAERILEFKPLFEALV